MGPLQSVVVDTIAAATSYPPVVRSSLPLHSCCCRGLRKFSWLPLLEARSYPASSFKCCLCLSCCCRRRAAVATASIVAVAVVAVTVCIRVSVFAFVFAALGAPIDGDDTLQPLSVAVRLQVI